MGGLENGGGRRRRLTGRVVALCAVGGLAAVFAACVAVSDVLHARAPWEGAPRPLTAARPASPVPAVSPPDRLSAARAIVAPAAPPTRLIVPAIGVDAQVEPVVLDVQGRMAAPSRGDRVGWYRPGAAAGDAGNTVMDGHLDWTEGRAVFWNLGKLRHGDEVVVVRADGSRVRFIVDTSAVVPYDAATEGLFTKSGPPSLTLITCAGEWDRGRETYLQRLVVRASLAAGPPAERPGDEGG